MTEARTDQSWVEQAISLHHKHIALFERITAEAETGDLVHILNDTPYATPYLYAAARSPDTGVTGWVMTGWGKDVVEAPQPWHVSSAKLVLTNARCWKLANDSRWYFVCPHPFDRIDTETLLQFERQPK